jgi:hypothetical protein
MTHPATLSSQKAGSRVAPFNLWSRVSPRKCGDLVERKTKGLLRPFGKLDIMHHRYRYVREGEIMMREIHAPRVFVEELCKTLTLKLRGIILDVSLF